MKKELLLSILVATITSCGGGGSSDSSTTETDQTSTPSTDNSNTDQTVNLDANIVAVSGMYNASRDNDESYLYISDTGMVTAYDYQQDVSGTGDNCYTKATGTELNGEFINVTFSESTNLYTLVGTDNEVIFSYNDTQGIHDLQTGFFSAGTGLNLNSSINGSLVNINVGGLKVSTPIVSDLESSICN